MLNLTKTHHAVLIDNRSSFLGMLKTAQNFITWGEPSQETVHRLIGKRGRLAGDKKLTDEYAEEIGYNSLAEFAEAVFNCEVQYWRLSNVQPVLRLPPPSGGFKGKTKKGYGMGGELGYRGEKINELISRMV